VQGDFRRFLGADTRQRPQSFNLTTKEFASYLARSGLQTLLGNPGCGACGKAYSLHAKIAASAWECVGLLFIPLSDDNPLKFLRYQWVTVGIIAANVVVFLLQLSGLGLAAGTSFAVVPSELLQVGIVSGAARGPYDVLPVPEMLTLITYMFLHADVVHLASNMMFLWVFGDNVEDAMGHVRYLVFYLLCGIAAALAQTLMQPESQLPLIGASGAVAGTIAAYLILHPRVLVWVLAFRIIPLRLTAIWILGLWVATQLFMVLINRGDYVAWWAHIGGLAAGAVLVVVMRRPGIVLLDRGAASTAARDAWWREYRTALFHRGLLRLRHPVRWATSLARYLRASINRLRRWASARLADLRRASTQSDSADANGAGAPAPRRTVDILTFEPRGENFALVRRQADGTSSEIVLTAANVVHLGLLAPGFSRQVLTEKVGKQPGVVAAFVRYRAMNANLRFIEVLLTILERGGARLDLSTTERRARALASRLMERADRIAKAPAKQPKDLR
jgi:membrane associated rhomboid family serine protease